MKIHKFSFLFLIPLLACQSAPSRIQVHFWAGDSLRKGITRSQEQKTIECHSPEFDDYVCVSRTDLEALYETLLLCQDKPDAF